MTIRHEQADKRKAPISTRIKVNGRDAGQRANFNAEEFGKFLQKRSKKMSLAERIKRQEAAEAKIGSR